MARENITALARLHRALGIEFEHKSNLLGELLEITKPPRPKPPTVAKEMARLQGFLDGLLFAKEELDDIAESLSKEATDGSSWQDSFTGGEVVAGMKVFAAVEKHEKALVHVATIVSAFDDLIHMMEVDGNVPVDIVQSAKRKKSLLQKLAICEDQLAWVFTGVEGLTPEQALVVAKSITDR